MWNLAKHVGAGRKARERRLSCANLKKCDCKRRCPEGERAGNAEPPTRGVVLGTEKAALEKSELLRGRGISQLKKRSSKSIRAYDTSGRHLNSGGHPPAAKVALRRTGTAAFVSAEEESKVRLYHWGGCVIWGRQEGLKKLGGGTKIQLGQGEVPKEV